ncbi:hypothetical protein AJ79_09762 [Helicocarpus griseus UAMH5409]|uniref:Uncharacterized protein n=1 Tax=Helicocarpus griseus UAMH5409 TaxID=1447875 RepID=A0A2B7WHM2_9EURO|nr:hypothetical protein AJ79_09762 [Helicocarpus griseus UAMH5409]
MQGFNMGRYIPPDLEGHTTANKLAGKHPLGSRARHLHTTGELTVRFEMPFAVWCTTCAPNSDNVLIGQGVRFNALKKRVGNYHSTPIYSFRMRHTACGGWIEIRTDPKNTAYVVTEGGRRRETGELEKGGYEEDGEIWLRPATAEGEEKDAFARLEEHVVDKQRAMTQKTRMEELMRRQERDWEDPYEQSKRLRRTFRAERRRRENAEGVTERLKDKMSLGIEILEESEGDRVRAEMVDFAPAVDRSVAARRVTAKPLFETKLLPATPSVGRERGKKGKELKPEAAAAQRKALLQQELSGNTRAAVDPFLLEDDADWTPGAKRRRTIGLSGAVQPGDELHQEGRGTSARASGGDSEHRSDHSHKERTEGATSRETSRDQRPQSSTPLVGYGSSDDSD